MPPHRQIDADGHPTGADLEDSIRTNQPSSIGLLAVERKAAHDVIGETERKEVNAVHGTTLFTTRRL
ncbi:MAG TPA: hypothetical protein VMA73_20465 [Streptosporangiaceae bacterium]|nr:hypothetical protein [Streptosporangiaceae bacterium]